MIRMFQSQTAGQAKTYFNEALSKADYYINDQELNGRFHGKLSARLGIENDIVDRDVFHNLCDNVHPKTGENFTPRTVENRRVGYDISFHCPKSVSILHAFGDDDRVLDSFRKSVHETMQEMEADMQTRVRIDGQNHDRDTGELMWTDFIHQTARPVDDHPPDPHLHCHCFTFNATWDKTENRIKAGQFHNIKRDMPWYQARFQKRLADNLSKLGYGIRKTGRSFEVSIVPQKAIEHFSKRTNAIGQTAKELGITDPEELDQLGARTRGKKQSSLSMPELKKSWVGQFKNVGIDHRLNEEIETTIRDLNSGQCIDHALNHSFARKSVERDRRILAEGYLHGIDSKAVSLSDIDQTFEQDERVFKVPDGKDKLCTTIPVQAEEKRMVKLAKNMRGTVNPLRPIISDNTLSGLNDEQAVAVNHILKSPDRLVMLRGGAGTGKTTMMKTAVKLIEETDRQVYAFAPTADASRDMLRSEGFKNADTVTRLLRDEELQSEIQDQVIWVDEAGMLGTKDMGDILELADDLNARVILTGDTRQHTAVQRGDAMRILRQVAGIPIPSLNRIYRQKGKEYRMAVETISAGDVSGGFDKLESLGCIEELESNDVSKQLANDYLKAKKENRTALVISPTNEQAQSVTKSIREGLKKSGKLEKKDRPYSRLKNLYYSSAQKQDWRSYYKGQVVQLHQNMPGLKKGSQAKISKADEKGIEIIQYGETHTLDLTRPNDFDVYNTFDINLSKGDRVRITKNSFDKNGRRLNNGKILEVDSFSRQGDIRLKTPDRKNGALYEIDKNFGNFNHAYCITSYASQGKTVDRVLIAQPSATFPASNMKQFYVSVSRGREAVKIYTDDKKDLLQTIHKEGDRMSVHELEALDQNRTQSKSKTKSKGDHEPNI
ncbi:MAG: MobF family relaxase [Balneola sp.]